MGTSWQANQTKNNINPGESNNILERFGIACGEMPKGKLNNICDVPGVLVGHATIDTTKNKTGVTVILPHGNNIFLHKVPGACHVLNGYGKTTGLMQIKELGTIETPIAITNTLNIGPVYDGIVQYIIDQCAKDKYKAQSINAIVCECNDSILNNIQNRAVTQAHVIQAIASASQTFAQGDIGAGKGTVCYGWKGGIGSASRIINVNNRAYTIGVLVQSNYGRAKDLHIGNQPIPPPENINHPSESDKGSIIMVLGTNLPLDNRQLHRIIKRMSVGMARLGSYIGHGSGEVMLGFTTQNQVHHLERDAILSNHTIREDLLDLAFRGAGECCEEAILKSMLCANTTMGYNNKIIYSLGEWMEKTGFCIE